MCEEYSELRKHYPSDTMKESIVKTLNILSILMTKGNTDYVFLLQADISENGILFYTKLRRYDPYDTDNIYSKKIMCEGHVKQELNIFHDIGIVRERFIEYIAEYGDTKRILVLCTSKVFYLQLR